MSVEIEPSELVYCREMLASAESAAVEVRTTLRKAITPQSLAPDRELLLTAEVLVLKVVAMREACRNRMRVHAMLAQSHGGAE